MKEVIVKGMKRHDVLEMVYLAKDGKISKRRVKVLKSYHDTFQAFCFTKQAKRTFYYEQILAVIPVTRKERKEVIS